MAEARRGAGERVASRSCEEALSELTRHEDALLARIARAPETPDLRPATLRAFRALVLDFHSACGRDDLPWRQARDPWPILVSEVMLQQTQVPRVRVVFPRFIERFPSPHVLADAPLTDVLEEWRGMGYNRRALALKRAAEGIVARHGGHVPRTLRELDDLPGVGPATAAAVLASAFGIGEPYVETNIRAVVLHVFYHDDCDVPDSDVLPVVARTLPTADPRTWYYALMDYGNRLKRREVNPCRRSRHHMTQAEYAGSMRQARGAVLRALVDRGGSTAADLAGLTGLPAERVARALSGMSREGLVAEARGRYRIA